MTPEFSVHNSIYIPPVVANNFQINSAVITLVQNQPFGGLPAEDPHVHITRFIRSCGMYRQNGVTEEVVRLKMFPFSLIGEAARWLDSHIDNHFRFWDQLHRVFMQEFFPLTKTLKLRRQIQDFKQGSLETLADAWRQFKTLKHQCPPDVLHPWDVISSFYAGLTDECKLLLDSSSRGSFVSTSPGEAEELIRTISSNTGNWYNQRESKGGLYEVSAKTASQAKVEALGLDVKRLQAQIEKMHKAQRGDPCMTLALYCDKCGGAHGAHECTSNYEDGPYEQVEAVGYPRPSDYNSYGNNNTQNWRQEDSKKTGGTNRINISNQGGAYRPPMYQGNNHGANQLREEAPKESMEDKMVRMFGELRQDMTNMRQEWKQDLRQEISTLRQEHHASLRNLETQVAQNSKALAERPQGALPSTTVNNPRERVHAVTLRSGKELPEPTLKKSTNSKSPIEEEIVEVVLEHDKEQEKEKSPLPSSPKAAQSRDKGKEKVDLPMYQPPLPFPGRVKKNMDKTQYGKFLELLKQLHINVPFLDALGQMPRYAKFLKDLFTNKRKLEESTTLDLGTLKPTRICIQLADRSIKQPKGVVEDVLVRVDKFIFPVDFVIIDMDPDHEVPLILGRPSLATARALIDVGSGKLVLRVGEECATFDVSKLTKYPMTKDDACYYVDVFHEHVKLVYPNLVGKLKNDALLRVLDDNDDLESFTFYDNALINENDDNLHEIVCGDDEMHVDDNVCDVNDIEFVNFFDDCLDDAIYIHELIGEVEEEWMDVKGMCC
ncbi:uncharacterized protein LOC116004803 [Ipomoea triloba]|uniref:uncharacterized protein LOC116004803 n=1 Tax=Ipomoea triloba TaxID=35885 RepID=UPI00125DB3EE|nr:uncharacterized protein LOC116004803 [Ipomoea triloba]